MAGLPSLYSLLALLEVREWVSNGHVVPVCCQPHVDKV